MLQPSTRGPSGTLHPSIDPWVLSVGKRCVEEGYSFIWVARTTPVLISPSGTQIPLVVNNNVPYLPIGDVEVAAPAA